MPDPIATIATLAKYLADYRKLRKDRRSSNKTAHIDQYLEWLRRKNHTELVELLQSNGELQAKVAELLTDRQAHSELAIQNVLSAVLGLHDRLDDLPNRVRAGLRDDFAPKLEAILHQFQQAARAMVDVDEKRARVYEESYRKAIVAHCGKIELIGADLSSETQAQELSVAYMPLSVTSSGDKKAIQQSTRADELMNTTMLAGGRLLIRAAAGAGKTTLLRWWAHSAASQQPNEAFERAVEKNLGETQILPDDPPFIVSTTRLQIFQLRNAGWRPWNERVPFLLLVRDIKDGGLPKPDEFPSRIAGHLGGPPPGWVVGELHRGALLLVDGIDEIAKNRRAQIREDLLAYAHAYPRTIIVVTTRPTAVRENWLFDAGFLEAQIDDMTPPDRELFVRKWHSALSKVLVKLAKTDDSAALADALIAELRRNTALSLLARNPLLAAMTCALHHYRRAKLPEKQHILVENLSEMLIFRREHESPGLCGEEFPECYRTLDYHARVAILRCVAEFMLTEGNRAKLPLETAQQKVASALRGLAGRNPQDAAVILDQLVERSGVLRKSGDDEIDFLHNTFKEYYAACELVSELKFSTLAAHATDPEWDNVLLFAAADPNSKQCATELIKEMLPPDGRKRGRRKPTKQDAEDYRRRLLAVRMASVALHLDPAVATRVENLKSRVIPPRSAFDAAALASLGQGCERLLAYDPKMTVAGRRWCARALRLIPTELARAELEAYLVDASTEVGEEVAEVFEPLQSAAWRTALVDERNALKFTTVRSRTCDLSPLAHLTAPKMLYLARTKVGDLTPLAGLTTLQSLDLRSTQVSDLAPLAGLASLKSLYLGGTQVSDLSPLAGLTMLRTLDLEGTHVTDLTPLASLTTLDSLHLKGTQVSEL